MFRYLPLIVKNCWRNRRRTTLTIVSIGVSMCLLGVLIAVYHALYLSDATPDQALRLVTRNRVSLTVPIPLFYRDRIRQVPGVKEIMSSQWFNGVYKDARDPKNFFARFGVDPPEKLFTIYGELKIPEDQKQAFIRDRTGTVIGRDLANKFNFHLGDRITLDRRHLSRHSRAHRARHLRQSAQERDALLQLGLRAGRLAGEPQGRGGHLRHSLRQRGRGPPRGQDHRRRVP
jgi:ABC-type lipoprotein release transport system permease subunit